MTNRSCAGFVMSLFFMASLLAWPWPLSADEGSVEILVYSAIVIKEPLNAAVEKFSKLTGVRVQVFYGGSGEMLNKLKINPKGDVYIAASPDFMDAAAAAGIVPRTGEVKICYLYPALFVKKGNPLNIKTLYDIKNRPELKFAIANPVSVPAGLYAAELLENAFGVPDEIVFARSRVVSYAENVEKLVALLMIGSVDMVIGWNVYSKMKAGGIEELALPEGSVRRISYLPAAVTNFSAHADQVRRFLEFLEAEAGLEEFSRCGFEVSEPKIKQRFPGAVIGGKVNISETWSK